jgi:peptide/nickel transport system permease protein
MVAKKSSLAKRGLRKLLSNRLSMLGTIVFFLMIFASIFAPLLTKYELGVMNLTETVRPPGLDHWFGTDRLGCDVFTQILYGGRVSLYVGLVGAVFGAFLGMSFGVLGGYFGGRLDALLVKVSEIFQTFPNMILVLILAGILGQGVNNLIIIFSLTGWMTTFRMVRNQILVQKEEIYVMACKGFGISDFSIMFRHILPNITSPIFVSVTINIAGYILQEAGLSFLGLGVPVTTPTWGNIMNAAKSIQVITEQWWLWLFPGLTISLFVLSVNFLGDGLRDVLDPRS